MLRKIVLAAVFLIALIAIGLYVINPSNTASADPRARIFGFAVYRIPSNSMAPTLQLGDYIFASTFAYRDSGPMFGDVISFRHPRQANQTYIKRVIGLPGDTINIVGMQVWRNGELIKEPYTQYLSAIRSQRGGEWKVPDGQYLVLGDNRDNSADSRSWGFVPRNHVIAKVSYVWRSENDNTGPVKHGE
jgi:signal peptidase I